MSNKNLVALLVVLALIVVGILVVVSGGDTDTIDNEDPTEEETDVPQVITAQHQFENGTHIIAGEITMPTPCDLLEWDTVIDDSNDSEVVTVQFTSRNESETCAQVVTSQRFKVEFDAAEDADIEATFDGEDVTLNLIEVGPDVDLDEFEIFIKG